MNSDDDVRQKTGSTHGMPEDSASSSQRTPQRVVIDTPGKSGFMAFDITDWSREGHGTVRFYLPEGEEIVVADDTEWMLGDKEVINRVG